MTPVCAECGKKVERDEPHYRSGLKWFHLPCYAKVGDERTREDSKKN